MNLDWIFGIASALADEGTPATAAVTATGDPNAAGETVSPILGTLMSFFPLILMGVVFYFFLIRPQRKKDKKVKEMLAALKPGDRIYWLPCGAYTASYASVQFNGFPPIKMYFIDSKAE